MIAAAPITDTVKRAPRAAPAAGRPRTARRRQTESRDHLWAAQTPQAFRAQALREALAADPQRSAAATDDAMLVEKAGGKVLIHPAPPENLKVTTPLDLRVAELLLADAASQSRSSTHTSATANPIWPKESAVPKLAAPNAAASAVAIANAPTMIATSRATGGG